MTDPLIVHDEAVGDWRFRIRVSRVPSMGFVGYAKRGEFLTPDVGMTEPGDIWFQWGPDSQAVLSALKAEVLH